MHVVDFAIEVTSLVVVTSICFQQFFVDQVQYKFYGAEGHPNSVFSFIVAFRVSTRHIFHLFPFYPPYMDLRNKVETLAENDALNYDMI